MTQSVLISVPTGDGWMRYEVAAKCLELSGDQRCDKSFFFSERKPCEYNRNTIAKRFLEGAWDYLLTIDADNAPLTNPLDLVALDKDVIVLPTPIYRTSDPDLLRWNVWGSALQSGLQRISRGGSGCMLIARRVLKAVPSPFSSVWNGDGLLVTGTDLAFCDRVLAAGFELWAHFDYRCQHCSTVDLNQLGEWISRKLKAEEMTL